MSRRSGVIHSHHTVLSASSFKFACIFTPLLPYLSPDVEIPMHGSSMCFLLFCLRTRDKIRYLANRQAGLDNSCEGTVRPRSGGA
jgi:hypothetical protein